MYPKIIEKEELFPLVGVELAKQTPLFVALDDDNSEVSGMNIRYDNEVLNTYVSGKLSKAGKLWSLSEYLGPRMWMMKPYPQAAEGRYVHIGVDIGLPKGKELFSPLDAKVVKSEYEAGPGNYGGLVVLEHKVKDVIFYSLYGHLDKDALPEAGTVLKKGDVFAKVGEFRTNNNGFYHTHMQILTEEGYNGGWVYKGYCTIEDAPKMVKICPNPLHLLTYQRERG